MGLREMMRARKLSPPEEGKKKCAASEKTRKCKGGGVGGLVMMNRFRFGLLFVVS